MDKIQDLNHYKQVAVLNSGKEVYLSSIQFRLLSLLMDTKKIIDQHEIIELLGIKSSKINNNDANIAIHKFRLVNSIGYECVKSQFGKGYYYAG